MMTNSLTTTTATTSSKNVIKLGNLLSTCVDACHRGCLQVRQVQAARVAHNKNVGDTDARGEYLRVIFKDAGDPRSALTAADQASHLAIVNSLRTKWGNDLTIVSEEEDGDDDNDNEDGNNNKKQQQETWKPLQHDLFNQNSDEAFTAHVALERITIFVDPVDGTREFVEGRLSACQVLIGIAVDGQPAAGVVGIPFPHGDLSSPSTLLYANMGVGPHHQGAGGEWGIAKCSTTNSQDDAGNDVHKNDDEQWSLTTRRGRPNESSLPLKRGPFPWDHNNNHDTTNYPRPLHATGDSQASVMVAARQGVIRDIGGSNVLYGGAGNKILAAALGEVTCSIQHKVGGPWDLCAPQAILLAMGGHMTDFFGQEMEVYHHPDGMTNRCNERGYLATSPQTEPGFHQTLVETMISLPEVQAYREKVQSSKVPL